MITYRVKQLATDRNISLNELAKRTGIMPATILPIWANENSNPLVGTLRKIAIALKVTVADLIDEPASGE